MKFIGEVMAQQNLGDKAMVSLDNVRRVSKKHLNPSYSPGFQIKMPFAVAKAYPIGRRVRVTIEAL